MNTEEIMQALEDRFSHPAGPVRYFATSPLAPPPPDPKPKATVSERVPHPSRAPRKGHAGGCGLKRATKEKRAECQHAVGWHRVRGTMPKVRCKRCREVRNVTVEELDILCPITKRDPKPIPHGTRTGYYRGCRLECCAAVERADRVRRYRKNKK